LLIAFDEIYISVGGIKYELRTANMHLINKAHGQLQELISVEHQHGCPSELEVDTYHAQLLQVSAARQRREPSKKVSTARC
jgi:hypothetical protein